jgi:elongator complex protein 4
MSSFRRFNQAKPTAPGTRTGSNGQKLTSSGVPSLDELYGGGIPLGRLLLLKQDRYSSYSNVLLKYYIAQGIMFGHESFVISLDSNPESILTELMGVVEGKSGSTVQEEEQQTRQLGQLRQGQMNIAWRYQNLPQLNSTLGKGNPSTFCHLFDLTKRMTPEHLSKSRITLVNREMVKLDPYDRVFELLEKKIQESTFQDSNVLRIAIHSIASPLWGTKVSLSNKEIISILASIKSIGSKQECGSHDDNSCSYLW